MGLNTLEYSLHDGFVHNWFLTGPYFHDQAESVTLDDREAIQNLMTATYPKSEMIADRSPVQVGEMQGKWLYYRSREDHMVSICSNSPKPVLGFAWVFTQVDFPQDFKATLAIRSSGPISVWMNGVKIFEDFTNRTHVSHVPVNLAAKNQLYVCMVWDAAGRQSQSFAIEVVCDEIEGLVAQGRVHLETTSKYPNRHQILEQEFEKAYLLDVVSYKGNKANLRWASDATPELRYVYQIQDDQERIYVEGGAEIKLNETVDIGHPIRIFERPYNVVLRAPAREYFNMGLKYQRELPLYIIDNAYSDTPYASYAARRTAALEDASRRHDNLFAEVAKMALGNGQTVDWTVVTSICSQVQAGDVESEINLLGLLGILYRFAEMEGAPAESLGLIEKTVLGSSYRWSGARDESFQAIQLASAILAGQRFPEATFGPDSRKGVDLLSESTQALVSLFRNKGTQGFESWGSDVAYERWVIALSHLVGVVDNDLAGELAAVLLDKLLFLLASGNFRGILAQPAASTSVYSMRSGQLQATSGLQRLLWGTGVFQRNIAGAVSLACSDYEFPSFFADIATQNSGEYISCESHGIDEDLADLVMFKTPEYALSSVQRYKPGEKGKSERIWQAWMGTEALVYTNHPENASDDEYHQPGYWLGNAYLPNVAQHKNTLIAIYNAPEDAWMGFTHAYFPALEMDEYRFEDDWVFARKGDAYLAIRARNGMHFVQQGPGAFRELRSEGRQNAWVCMLGAKSEYNDFRGFQKKIMKCKVDWMDLGVSLTTPQGDALSLSWHETLMVNGQNREHPSANHIENPNCTAEKGAKTIEIQHAGMVMRMNFE